MSGLPTCYHVRREGREELGREKEKRKREERGGREGRRKKGKSRVGKKEEKEREGGNSRVYCAHEQSLKINHLNVQR